MMKHPSGTLFARIMGVVMVSILLLTAGIGGVGWALIRDRQVNNALDALKKDAREIAYLAEENLSSSYGLVSISSTALDILKAKAASVYREYGAYILVVDWRGRTMDNLSAAYAADPDFVASLNSKDLSEELVQVLSGNEVSVRVMVSDSPRFTVGVPLTRNGSVLGAVLIQTPAQRIESGLGNWLYPLLLLAAAAIMVTALCMMLFLRSVLRPLRQATLAARAMAGGDFSARIPQEKTAPEMTELANAFNTMADKLADNERSRREFVANVSHELRSPITSIAGFVQGMQEGVIPPEEHAHYLSVVHDETNRLSKLIGQLLALSRLERDDAQLELSDFDMCEMLRRAIIRRMNDLERKHMEVDCDFVLEPCMVHADSDRVEQVVVNLLDNAIRFTPDGGCIQLCTEERGDMRLIRVRDNGVGILPEDRPRVFERFFTVDQAHTSGNGTGLGLAISQRIVEMHGGTIALEDVENGSSFVFTLSAACVQRENGL